MSDSNIQVQQRWLVVCDQCPDFDVESDTAGEAEDSARAHLEESTDYDGFANYGHKMTIAQVTKVGRYL